ncbi:unnamed protein product, partial [Meganyctiphanes norvegica]
MNGKNGAPSKAYLILPTFIETCIPRRFLPTRDDPSPNHSVANYRNIHFSSYTGCPRKMGILFARIEVFKTLNNCDNIVVTWMRQHDSHVLTVGMYTYTTDQRFTSLRSDDEEQWSLRIAAAQISDSGVYECQVSTEPKISRIYTLQIVDSRAVIDGPVEVHMVSGSSINLTCSVVGAPDPPKRMHWYKDHEMMNYSARGGISLITNKKRGTSRLLVTLAMPSDSGNYTCKPNNADPATVAVYILYGEHPMQAMQGFAESLVPTFAHRTLALVAVILILIPR